jgi:hypothetical protein
MLIQLNYINNRYVNISVDLYSIKFLQTLSMFILVNLKKFLNFIIIKNYQLHIFINKDFIFEVCFFLKNSIYLFCNQLLDITVVDRIEFLNNGYR